MDEKVKQELEQETLTPLHEAILSRVKGYVQLSRNQMQSRYSQWDCNDDAYRNIRQKDQADRYAENRGEPVKGVIPVTRSQVITFVVLTMGILLQRPKFFELQGTSVEDVDAAKKAEALLDNDLRYNKFVSKLWQYLLDVARFGFGVFKVSYDEVYVKTLQKQAAPMFVETPGGVQVPGVSGGTLNFEDSLEFLGNVLTVVSPYSFFPDPRRPLQNFQAGEFCAAEFWYGRHELKRFIKAGDVADSLDLIGPLDGDSLNSVEDTSRRRFPKNSPAETMHMSAKGQSGGMYLLTECQIEVIPNEFELANGDRLGEDDTPVKYNVWMLNDSRIVKFEPLGFVHDEFTYAVGELHPDNLQLVNEGLVDSVDFLQSVIDWFVNSRITNVRKVIGDKLLVRSRYVEMSDLTERNPVIRIKPSADDKAIKDIVQQLQMTDVTTNHLADVAFLIDMVEKTTGITETAQGEFHKGRRSAREAGNVASSIAARMRVPTSQIFENCFAPMGKQMIKNHQQGLTQEVYVKVVGDANADPQAYADFTRINQGDLVGRYDFTIFDGTLPSERDARAIALQDFLAVLVPNPELVTITGYDIDLLIREWLVLRGIKHPEAFKLTPERRAELMTHFAQAKAVENGPQQPTTPGAPPQGPGLP